MPTKTKQQNKKIPKLRFPEFSGEWEEKRLGEVLDYEQPTKYIVKNIEYDDNYKIPVLTAGKTFILGYTNENIGVYKNVPVIIFDDFTTTNKYVNFPFKVKSSAMKILKTKNNSYNLKFVFKAMQLIRFELGDEHKRFWISEYSKIKIKIPSLPEQQKIASFLSAVDERIKILRAKREALAKYKKGIMQKIFPAKGRQVPEIRFKDNNGKDFPEWEEKRLGEVCKKESSNISANVLENNTGDYEIYGANGVFKKVDFYQQEEGYISIVKDGAGVGRVFLCEPKTSVLGTLDIIKPKNQINLFFLYLLLQRIKFIKYVTGSTIPHIYFKDYSKIKIKIPSLPEQQKIANFLSAIDKKIELVDIQIQKMQEWKRGLMQGLFV